jgi:hypothetical protein
MSVNCNNENPWVRLATEFVKNNSSNAQTETVKFLLENGCCGVANRTHSSILIEHLQKNGYDIKRTQDFQYNILIPLKKAGIVASRSHSDRGVFIPQIINEVRDMLVEQYERFSTSLENIKGLAFSDNTLVEIIKLTQDETNRFKLELQKK